MPTRSTHTLINADLGEGGQHDAAIMPLIDLANVACGGHAGDVHSMRACLELAAEHGVKVGAHPSYPDREGFGRRRPTGGAANLYGELCRQMEAFETLVANMGLRSTHFKPHGQLYNDAAFNAQAAGLVLRVAADYPHLALVVLAGSSLVAWAEDEGIEILEEGFADRGYMPDGSLVPRQVPGALIHDEQVLEQQAIALSLRQPFPAVTGELLTVQVDTLCVHGDSAQALRNARLVRQALQALRSE